MPSQADRSLVRQALRGTLFVAAIAAVTSGLAIAIAALFTVVMT